MTLVNITKSLQNIFKLQKNLMSHNFKNYKRILFKLSGEALMGDKKFGHDAKIIDRICNDIKTVIDLGIQICIVVGGGNIFRGVSISDAGMERANADNIGMLATVINSLALQNALEKRKIFTRVLSAVPMMTICETYIRRRAVRHMQKGRLVIFAAGLGNPFFTTDTASVLRAVEMNCDAIFKGTQVNGVYDKDPKKFPTAVKYDEISYLDVLDKGLKVMDSSAIALAKDNDIPIIVFSIQKENEFANVLANKASYTIIKGDNNGN